MKKQERCLVLADASMQAHSHPPTPAPPSRPQCPPEGACQGSAMSSSHQPSNGGAPALGSVHPLSANPFSSEGQPLWEEGQGRGCEPRPAVCVWIPINSREAHFPCQGDWKKGKKCNPLCLQVDHRTWASPGKASDQTLYAQENLLP